MRQPVYLLVLLVMAAWLLFGVQLAGQSRSELTKKYGEPVSETFIASPDMSVTASFGTNGRITEILISPTSMGFIKSRGKTLNSDLVKLTIDELIPRSVRGKHLISGFINAACLPENDCFGTSDDYEKVSIYYNSAAEGRVRYAVVHFKN